MPTDRLICLLNSHIAWLRCRVEMSSVPFLLFKQKKKTVASILCEVSTIWNVLKLALRLCFLCLNVANSTSIQTTKSALHRPTLLPLLPILVVIR